MKNFWIYLSTLGPIGYLPAPGTLATVATLPVLYFIATQGYSFEKYLVIIAITACISFFIIRKSLDALDRQDDPQEIVLDEVVGCMVAFCAVPYTLPLFIIGFFLFRLFDITKTFGVGGFELLFGAWGIMLDDIAAGILTNILLQIIISFSH